MIANERIADLLSRLTGVPRDELKRRIAAKRPLVIPGDSLDVVELIVELEEEYDKETIRCALRYLDACGVRVSPALRPDDPPTPAFEYPDPLWDWDLDG